MAEKIEVSCEELCQCCGQVREYVVEFETETSSKPAAICSGCIEKAQKLIEHCQEMDYKYD